MKEMTRRNIQIYVFCFVAFIIAFSVMYLVGKEIDRAFKPKGFLGIGYDNSLIITQVLPNSPAERNGLAVGDKILSINGGVPITPADVQKLISKSKAGDQISITIFRKISQTKCNITFHPTLVERPAG